MGGCCGPPDQVLGGASYLEQRQPCIIVLIIAIEAFLPTHIESFLHDSLWWLPKIANAVTSDAGIGVLPFEAQYILHPHQGSLCHVLRSGFGPVSFP